MPNVAIAQSISEALEGIRSACSFLEDKGEKYPFEVLCESNRRNRKTLKDFSGTGSLYLIGDILAHLADESILSL